MPGVVLVIVSPPPSEKLNGIVQPLDTQPARMFAPFRLSASGDATVNDPVTESLMVKGAVAAVKSFPV